MSRFEIQLGANEKWTSGGVTYADGYVGPMDSNDVDTLYLQRLSQLAQTRGEQPETSALPKPGALRGDVPLSSPDKEIK
jgi:hypothetical protein